MQDQIRPRDARQMAFRILAVLFKWLLILCASSTIVVLGAIVGQHYIKSQNPTKSDLVRSFAAWDGGHYMTIAESGYSYDSRKMSNVAFFPAYPLAGRFIAALTHWRMDVCLLIVSYGSLIIAGLFAALYVEGHHAECDTRQSCSASTYVLMTLAFFPTTFYFRMAYSESLFIFTVILTLYGMRQRWPMLGLAAVIGSATATRPTGVALLIPFVWHVWERARTRKAFVVQSTFVIPAACWGLIAYMSFLYLNFGDPLAFAKTHKYWDHRPAIPILEKLWLDLTLEPIECVYDPSCTCYSGHAHGDPSPVFSMYFANPLYFLLCAAFVGYGAINGWLNTEECLAGGALLLVSYLGKGYSICMFGQARYASIVFPFYLVLGHLLLRLHSHVVAIGIAVCGFFLGIYSALFVCWYPFY